jgi:octaprenyl-diphosphate synthase
MTAFVPARPTLTPTLADIQVPVRARLDRVTEDLRRIILAQLPLIDEVNSHLLLMKGKMFRPTLVLLASAVEGSEEPRATTLAAILELVHLATLVHDDSVDHSALRRGMPTVNSLFSHQLSVIMGDFLYSTALTKLVGLGDLDALRALTRASTEMTVGEMRQLSVMDTLTFDEQDYYALIRAKTASLISAACEIGSLAGARNHRVALADYGTALGMAFQIADDLIDYTEQQATTGKPSGLDLKEHKVTLPLIAALKVMGTAERQKVSDLFATSEPADHAVREVIGIVAENGGLDYARERGAVFADQAMSALIGLPETVARAALIESISYVMERHA